jgi:hypothetical protein
VNADTMPDDDDDDDDDNNDGCGVGDDNGDDK